MAKLSISKFATAFEERIKALEEAVTSIGYDAKASKRRRFPTKKQELVMHSITKALCVETIDPWKENRVRFFHPLLHDPRARVLNLPFASPVSAMGGFDDCGLNWVPPAGSTLLVFFEGGSREAPFYLGTTWHRSRGPQGRDLTRVFPSREYQSVYHGHRGGYLHGPDDESQCLPQWNTESANAGDIDQLNQFTNDPAEQRRSTYPNIYGFKTPEKHMLKMVDGDAKCNRRWKRFEILSGCGNWMIFKDDHLHHGGQWAHPSVDPTQQSVQDISTCADINQNTPYFTDIHGTPIERNSDCQSGNFILGGHPSTPGNPPNPETVFFNSNKGKNRFFKHANECRPYRGVGTPQNNKCALPQSGIQFLSLAGHTWVCDDSVEEPSGKPVWERSLSPFDFGCTDKFMGQMFMKSATGQKIVLSDIESQSKLRGSQNYILLESATGNRVELNDHTVGEGDCPGCPPNHAGDQRGVTIKSSSNHAIRMVDHMNLQCSPCRREGGVPVARATRAYIQIKSGYGLEMRFNDDFSQESTQQQWIQIMNPQCVSAATDQNCNTCDSNDCRGPHFLRLQGRRRGQPGIVFLRAGGHSIRQTYDRDIVVVGDKEKNPSDKFTYVSRHFVTATEKTHFQYAGEAHILFSEQRILLMAGRDCPPEEGKRCKGPCLFNVIVARCPVFCPLTNILHWTEKAVSERVFASGFHACGSNCDGVDCEDYNTRMSQALNAPCTEDGQENSETIDTGEGNGLTVPTMTPPSVTFPSVQQ